MDDFDAFIDYVVVDYVDTIDEPGEVTVRVVVPSRKTR
jgi:hypothetical protein